MDTLRYVVSTPLAPGISLGRAFLMLAYFGTLLFAALNQNNIFVNPGRAGAIAVSQLPSLYALGTKNSPFDLLLGLGYERLNFYHRYMGRLVVLAANVHAVGYIYKWAQAGQFGKHIQSAEMQWGLLALICFDILFFFSLSIFRQRFYQFFYVTHFLALLFALIAIGSHREQFRPYVAIAAALYVIDRVFRVVRSRIGTAHIETIPEIGTTLVRFNQPRLNAGWKAGQHVRVRVMSLKMGWFAWADVHPFTIASAPRAPSVAAHFRTHPTLATQGDDGGELVLMIKKAGDWTDRLYHLADEPARERPLDNPGTNIKMIVEGPYGEFFSASLASFSGAMVVVGGSGISFGLSAVQDLLHNASPVHAGGISTIELIWCVQSARAIKPLIPVFKALLSQSARDKSQELLHSSASSLMEVDRPTLKVSVYYTRAPTQQDNDALMTLHENDVEDASIHEKQASGSPFPSGISLHAGRPKLSLILESVTDRTTARLLDGKAGVGEESLRKPSCKARGVVIAVCGPGALAEDCRGAVGDIDHWKKRAVGGIELVTE
ncbi:hypothetical protein K474DRAFT_1588112 [Panus rudis PR-1116 ss-1]|nr:hypothetical protein K474DRAFT_1588112 [Panus rudis PR-1116 ss-1]